MFSKNKSDLLLCIILLTKNNDWHSQMQQFNIKHSTGAVAFRPSLAWLQPERRTNSWFNKTQLYTVKYITFASVNL